MNVKKQHWVLYLIVITIVATITVQLYWNYKNYKQNEQRVVNEIQISLDNAIEEYYANLSKQNSFAIIEPKLLTAQNELEKDVIWEKILEPIKKLKKKTKNTNLKDSVSFKFTSVFIDLDKNDSIEKKERFDDFKRNHINPSSNLSTDIIIHNNNNNNNKDDKTIRYYKTGKKGVQFFKGKKSIDSLKLIKGLQTIYIAIQTDSLNYKSIDSILKNQLETKGISTSFYLNHIKKDSLIYSSKNANQSFLDLNSEAKSTYLKENEKLFLFYKSPIYETLKRSSTGILLSFLLSLSIVFCLFYLLKIINKQKELAEIKNDLISNITHEFKTPITTISAAIEAIDNFNIIDDKEKTKKYLSISTIQLKKLHQMVEKLLETATLDSENLMLKKESIDIIDLIEKTAKKHELIASNKSIIFSSNLVRKEYEVDGFHFENAISNLIDNSIKYGGNKIEISVNIVLGDLEISVTDNGSGIDKNQQEKVFTKFYRVPKGNTHDVKGFGIGLYYTKKIIEKHDGLINLVSNTKRTIFKITLPND